MKDLIFGVAGLLIFMAVAVYLVVQWIKSYSWTIQEAFCGTVVEKRRYSMYSKSRRHDNKDFFVIARINGRIMEGKCEFEIYRNLDVGDEVCLFNIGTREWYAIS